MLVLQLLIFVLRLQYQDKFVYGHLEQIDIKIYIFHLISLCQFLYIQYFINSNTCAAIENEFPDYDPIYSAKVDLNRANCKFSTKTTNCKANKDSCSTHCCTEDDITEINAHSCSKYSSKRCQYLLFFQQ
ncbi:unnamed protein product [Paramecium sonneborni]|uniref:Uncharacterized protein n=1 Tax=Paramecium sonneborni TaxID=65129 RepID=A0A8S1PE98_9CILI|nr:unnamed protein product [Paramecium sonneborni]